VCVCVCACVCMCVCVCVSVCVYARLRARMHTHAPTSTISFQKQVPCGCVKILYVLPLDRDIGSLSHMDLLPCSRLFWGVHHRVQWDLGYTVLLTNQAPEMALNYESTFQMGALGF
jgi:hypothetical protein